MSPILFKKSVFGDKLFPFQRQRMSRLFPRRIQMMSLLIYGTLRNVRLTL